MFVIIPVSVLIGMSIEAFDSRSALEVLLSAWVYLSPSVGAAYVVAIWRVKKIPPGLVSGLNVRGHLFPYFDRLFVILPTGN